MGKDEIIKNVEVLQDLEDQLASIKEERDSIGAEPHPIVVKTINGHPYYYEQWRESGKLKNKSLGAVSPGILAKREREKQRYKELSIEISDYEYRIIQQRRIVEAYKNYFKNRNNLEDYIFEVYWKNELSSRVSVKGSRVIVNRIIRHPLHQIFPAGEISRHRLNDILELRCFDRHRPDAAQKLQALGLTEYRPIDIVRRTHGVSYNDFIWFRFMGEDLRAEDVLVRDINV